MLTLLGIFSVIVLICSYVVTQRLTNTKTKGRLTKVSIISGILVCIFFIAILFSSAYIMEYKREITQISVLNQENIEIEQCLYGTFLLYRAEDSFKSENLEEITPQNIVNKIYSYPELSYAQTIHNKINKYENNKALITSYKRNISRIPMLHKLLWPW